MGQTSPSLHELRRGRGRSVRRFLATSGRSDFSVALIVGYGLRPSRQRPGHDWRRSPGSRAKGLLVSRDINTGHVAFCGTEDIGTLNLAYAAQYLACALPCERFTSDLADSPFGAGAVRYSFTATDFHRLPFAGSVPTEKFRQVDRRTAARKLPPIAQSPREASPCRLTTTSS
jgi:hypothetical protein